MTRADICLLAWSLPNLNSTLLTSEHSPNPHFRTLSNLNVRRPGPVVQLHRVGQAGRPGGRPSRSRGQPEEGNGGPNLWAVPKPVSYTHLRAHETRHDLVCR